MFQSFAYLGQGFIDCMSPINIFCCIIGVLVGTLAGVLPGLGISGSVAILLPITYSMDPLTALIMVSGIFFGSQYGCAIYREKRLVLSPALTAIHWQDREKLVRRWEFPQSALSLGERWD